MVGPDDLIKEALRFNTNDLGVNVLAQVAAAAGLSTKSQWFPTVRATTRANQERIRALVSSLPDLSLPVFPSQANMFLIDIAETGVTPVALQKELLLTHGVFVRAGNYLSPKYGGRFIRVSFSNPPADIDRLVRAFPVALEKLRKDAAVARPAPAPAGRDLDPIARRRARGQVHHACVPTAGRMPSPRASGPVGPTEPRFPPPA